MNRSIIGLCLILSLTGISIGNSRFSNYRSGYGWTHGYDNSGRLAYLGGFRDGYQFSSEMSGMKTANPSNPNVEMLKHIDAALSGHSGSFNMGQLSSAVSAFYNDYRNQGICIPVAVAFSAAALSGQPVSEQQLAAARSGSAKGCD